MWALVGRIEIVWGIATPVCCANGTQSGLYDVFFTVILPLARQPILRGRKRPFGLEPVGQSGDFVPESQISADIEHDWFSYRLFSMELPLHAQSRSLASEKRSFLGRRPGRTLAQRIGP